jgi:predicted ferric reductase
MVNEKRVKHMVKLAFYESKGGSEEIRIDSIPKKQYINMHTFLSVLWMTLAFLMIVVFFCVAFLNLVITALTRKQLLFILLFGGIAYIALLVIYVIKARVFYKTKHARAHHHVKQFNKDLDELERMYEKEEQDGENI